MFDDNNDTVAERNSKGNPTDDTLKLDTKCMYAGKLERTKQWRETTHTHPFCEIMFVLLGSGEVTVDGMAYPVSKGDIVVYNPNTPHSESTPANEGFELAFFGITNFQIGNLALDYLIAAGKSPVLHSGKEEQKFEMYFRSLVAEVNENRQYGDLMTKYWSRLILIDVLRLADISDAKFVTNAIFARIHNYLLNNYLKVESMDQICSDLHVSKYYVSHVFKKYIGTPPMQYVAKKRISHAKKLLQETDMSASEIGENCGYKDHVLFFKAFKKSEGMTPIQYRKTIRAQRKK
ncbi:MAG: helix-turn-helix domain-containing protein [Ruminococcaceae bacterium]|nr:helix-turn-helix domain-containing protein [Oscillospiraceae bacterium]